MSKFLLHCINSERLKEQFNSHLKGVGVPNLHLKDIREATIPLPPLSIQKEIVEKIESFQRIIDGAKQVVSGYKPQIDIQLDWEMVELGEVCNFINGKAFKPEEWESKEKGGLPIIRIQNLNNQKADFNYFSELIDERYIVNKGELLFSWSGSRGTSFGAHIWKGEKAVLNQHIFNVKHDDRYLRGFLYQILNQAVGEIEENLHGGVGLVHITKGNLELIKIPLPPLEEQKQIVAQIEREQSLVNANRELISIFEQKIKDEINKLWEKK